MSTTRLPTAHLYRVPQPRKATGKIGTLVPLRLGNLRSADPNTQILEQSKQAFPFLSFSIDGWLMAAMSERSS